MKGICMGVFNFEKINIRGIDFANVTADEALEIAKSYIAGDKTRAVFTPNAEITP
jgi:UDP-N-acetyl-D-mannosaminuronic acid transferase (WecB/TagA/CpsF family)